MGADSNESGPAIMIVVTEFHALKLGQCGDRGRQSFLEDPTRWVGYQS